MSSDEERTFTRLLEEQRAQNNPVSANRTSEAEWRTKLSGKKIVDGQANSVDTFSKKDLPEKHRVVPPGAVVTKDYYPDRLNVHVDEQGNATHVTYG
ncbi:unnamed protein product [Tuber melanosporum]|uniref:(Perigord truffle) hypothetical protein n=1 Tax=Tuber melanosporum (strain Mel28) TaxID=656061 RepID=D5GNP7_TUBMM|nr:uncharacterized protein GSTUM_00011417001 [Tuber melanosporum]CAZ86144.1 unnamed protein product [Tuber melanosporum]